MSDGKMTYETKTLRNEYMKKAQDIGSGAIALVKEFFDTPIGIVDSVNNYQLFSWTLTDLDRALDVMAGECKGGSVVNVESIDRRYSYYARKGDYKSGLGFNELRLFNSLNVHRTNTGRLMQFESFSGNKSPFDLKMESTKLLRKFASVFYKAGEK